MAYQINSTSYKSPNSSERSKPISMILVHSTASDTLKSAADWLCAPWSEVSTHYIIDEIGGIYQLVDDEHVAWHAGKSVWNGLETTYNNGTKSVNDVALGIELVNSNNGKDPYEPVQIDALTWLVEWKARQYRIAVENIVRHLDVAIPKGRKTDPAGFPWAEWKKTITASLNVGRDVWAKWGTVFPLYSDEKVFGIPQFWLKHPDVFGEARSNEIWIDSVWSYRVFQLGVIWYIKKTGIVHGMLNTGLIVTK